jgi:phosphatidate cytidylyltransferase
MAPALSPNKTMEGSIAGLLIGTVAGVVFWKLLLGDGRVGVMSLILVSLFATCAAQAADLSKSYLKRLRGVKDTGSFFPGHGGILDRFDGMIGAAPIVVVALLLWELL